MSSWEDNGQDEHDGDEVGGGPNHEPSLSQGTVQLRQFGASRGADIGHVRDQRPHERPAHGSCYAGANSSPGH
ncbi:CPCC family cysteine-rich protein [Nonomuraea polychroma]|uniref:CPCC family cysteine-rich protein n=1 Tax=Nonomuraea polychroma TaxID=46176 RepID=UPI003D8A586E